jgi:hypothetical protein
MHNDLVAQKLGFKDYNELLLYEDVCANALDFSTVVDIVDPQDPSIHFRHTKEEFEKFINDANLNKLFNSVKDLNVVDRLIQVYLYYYNLHIITDTVAIDNHKKFVNDLGVLPNLDKEEYLENHERLGNVVLISVDAMDYILNQANSRLNNEELTIFNNSTMEAQKTFDEYEIKSFGM